jgi:hypothetical protein
MQPADKRRVTSVEKKYRKAALKKPQSLFIAEMPNPRLQICVSNVRKITRLG